MRAQTFILDSDDLVQAAQVFMEVMRPRSDRLRRAIESLVVAEGDWPDRFVLLNRYHRTDYLPRWFKILTE